MLHVTRYSGYLLAAGLIAGVSFAAAPDLAASDTHRVRIDAEVVPGAGPIRDGVQFTIESLTGNFRQTVVSEPVGPVQLDLPEGRYMVTAVYDTAVVRDDLYVDGVDDYLTVNLNAGWVELDLIHGVGRPVKGDTQWVIETYGRTASGQRKRMHEETSEQTVRLALPGGWFVVTALNGGVRTKHTIEVTPGTTYTYDIVKKKVTQSSQACGDTSQVTKTC